LSSATCPTQVSSTVAANVSSHAGPGHDKPRMKRAMPRQTGSVGQSGAAQHLPPRGWWSSRTPGAGSCPSPRIGHVSLARACTCTHLFGSEGCARRLKNQIDHHRTSSRARAPCMHVRTYSVSAVRRVLSYCAQARGTHADGRVSPCPHLVLDAVSCLVLSLRL